METGTATPEQIMYEELRQNDITPERAEVIKKALFACNVLVASPALGECGHPMTHTFSDAVDLVDDEEHELQIWRVQTINQGECAPFACDVSVMPTVYPLTGQILVIDDD